MKEVALKDFKISLEAGSTDGELEAVLTIETPDIRIVVEGEQIGYLVGDLESLIDWRNQL